MYTENDAVTVHFEDFFFCRTKLPFLLLPACGWFITSTLIFSFGTFWRGGEATLQGVNRS